MSKLRTIQTLLLAVFVASPALAAGPQLSQVPPAPAATPAPVAPVRPAAVPAPVSTATEGEIEEPATDEKKPRSLFEDSATIQTGLVTIKMAMPPNSRAVDTISVHPYPVKPPVVKAPPTKLPVKEQDLKYMLMASGYNSRPSPDKPYQLGGWRWQYSLAEAERKAGLTPPHTIMGAYQWINDIMPWIQRENAKWNAFEAERYKRYQRCEEDFEKNKAEAENEATQQGLFPFDVREHKSGTTKVKIPAGSWWLTCTRKVPALTFYWQIPFTVGPDESTNVVMNVQNALIVKGGW